MSQPVIGVITLGDQVTAPGAATAALAGAGAGNVDNGAHRVKVTFVTASGETEAGTQSGAATVVNKAADGKIAITGIPVSSSALVTGRNVYMSDVAATGFFLLSNGTIANNSATTLTANDSDATLVASTAAPSTNTTSVAKNLQTALIAGGLTGFPALAQLILSPTGGGSASLSSSADIGSETAGLPLGDSLNLYATSPRDPVETANQYLFSDTVNQTIAFYARPIL